jgi:tetratricopeptide (TPR) repeat protein
MGAERSELFGDLLKAGLYSAATLGKRTGAELDELELGPRLGLAASSLQRFRGGDIPPAKYVAIFADVAVRQGLMGKPWLERFLHAARYPIHEGRALIAQYFPPQHASARPMIRPNLPVPTYSQFVMRSAAYQAVLAGLRSELAATIIVSLGGMGKTSLARAVAGAYQDGYEQLPSFAAVVWISDFAQPGTTTFSTVLDTIARVLDYPGLLEQAHPTKLREIEQLLRTQATLLIIDNAETINDSMLLEWLPCLPRPSKVLITSRVALPVPAQLTTVELDPMNERESRELVAVWLARNPIRGVPNALAQLLPIAETVGGNPKAIEVALGLVQKRGLSAVVADLRAARAEHLFDDLFLRSWLLLDAAAQRVLLTMTLFPASAPWAALAYVADLLPGAFDKASDQLSDLSLLDREQSDLHNPPRYSIHPLVRAFSAARLRTSGSEPALRERWLAWVSDLAGSVGFCWNDLDRLERLDQEHEIVQAALEWTVEQGRHRETIALAEGVRYYYSVRGLWDEQRLANYARRASAARQLGDASELVLSLAQHAEVKSKQATLATARELLAEAEAAALGQLLSDDASFELGHARALLAYASKAFSAAEAHWRALLPFAAELGGQKYVINRRWLATCLLDQGQPDEAVALYQAALADAEACNDLRSVAGNSLKLAAIRLNAGELAAAADALERSRTLAERYQDRRRLAEYYQLTAALLVAQGDHEGAEEASAQAADLFARMGMSGR